jgi:hypothetical protein
MVKQTRYVVKSVDQDGDGIPDYNIIERYVDNKLIDYKVVPIEKLKKIASKIKVPKEVSKVPKQKVVYSKIPAETDAPLVVQNQSSFGQYVKAGAGMKLGAVAMDGLISGIGSLFD